MDISGLIAAANQRLKSARIQVAIVGRGKAQNLYLRSSLLPLKPGSRRTKDKRIAIALLMPGTPETIAFAEQQAKILDAELKLGRFDWGNWEKVEDNAAAPSDTCEFWAEQYRQKYQSTVSEQSWRNYNKALIKLPKDKPLTLDLLARKLDEYPPDSSSRKLAAQVYRQLAEMASLSDVAILKTLSGKYSQKSVNPRDLPSDAEISATVESLNGHRWQWIVGMMAAYGLRNHEVFLVDLEDFPEIHVADTNKTRTGRIVRPVFPEWAEAWGLGDMRLPPRLKIANATNQKLGRKVSMFFYRNMPFSAYNLRHCYARRCFECDVPIKLAARMMGHSVFVHEKIYRSWISESAYAEMFERVMGREDRPSPPL